MAVNLDAIEAVIRNAKCGFALCFTPHRGAYKFALASGVVLTAAEYKALSARFEVRPLVDLVSSETSRRARLRAHARADAADT